jgi:phospholipid/cholesterol/gamma-HCH transport system substrate-binding protein
MSGFKKTSQGLNDLILDNKASLNNTFSNFDKASSNLVNLTDSLASADITKMMNDLQKTLISLNSLMAGLEKGEGSMGKLLKDETLYNNLEGATYEMEALLKDIKLHPKRYFRIMSKKEIPYKEEN